MTTLAFADTETLTPSISRHSSSWRSEVVMVKLNDALWRLTRHSGEVFGYVESFTDPRGLRFRAKRLNRHRQRFIVLGEFWRLDDAIDSLSAD